MGQSCCKENENESNQELNLGDQIVSERKKSKVSSKNQMGKENKVYEEDSEEDSY
jgi:hypothetical protein